MSKRSSPLSEGLPAARNVVPLFDPARLQLAREARGWSQRDLAVQGDLTPAAISQFESGASRPSSATLVDLSAALRFPIGFFARSSHTWSETEGAFFRSLRSAAPKDRKRAEAWTKLLLALVQSLETYVRFPEVRVPTVRVARAASVDDIEDAARIVRKSWNLGLGPISNVVEQLERHGIVVARLPAISEKLDAFSIGFEERPVVISGTDTARDRGRFNAAHELGHLVMHSALQAGEKSIESQAHTFAAAFLMPSETIERELPSEVNWRAFLHLKARWGVSLQALLIRARDLGKISGHTYVQAMKYMSARAWRRSEPGSLGSAEAPVLLARAVDVVVQEGDSIHNIAARAHLSEGDVIALLGSARDNRPSLSF